MAIIKPFKAYRPVKELASKIAALPYDVMNTEEAREMAKGNKYSFLYVDPVLLWPVSSYDFS